ncbi:MAG: ABC transporter ATP-binding protein [Thermodesulfobacteriota bacterium]
MSYKPIIEIKNVWKKFNFKKNMRNTLREDIENLFLNRSHDSITSDEFWALKDINLNIKKGESIGLYGPNGSGKTTIIKILANVTHPTKGDVHVNGRVAPLISVGAGFHPELTGKENIYTNGVILGMSIKQIRDFQDQIIEFSGLDSQFLDMPVKKYSSGMTTRLGFSVAVHSNADIFLLDETLAVGDESFKEKSSEKILSLMKENKTFVIVSHNLDQMKRLTNSIYYLEKGTINNIESINSN